MTYGKLLSILSNFTGSFSADPTVVSDSITILVSAGTVMQTALVFPGDGVMSEIFPELIGNTVLTVYRGTGTILRAWSSAPTAEYAQFDAQTGEITVAWAFGEGESLWVEYITI